MVTLFECSRCKQPFVASDEDTVAKRGGCCLDCAKVAVLRSWGLREDFLTNYGFG